MVCCSKCGALLSILIHEDSYALRNISTRGRAL